MTEAEFFSIVECILFVSGEPVGLAELGRTLDISEGWLRSMLTNMRAKYVEEERGIIPSLTDDTVQLISNRKYASYVENLLQPAQTKTFSQAMLETLSVVAYMQPVTRSDIEAIRGVRCDYSVAQLLKQGLICEAGRKDCVGRPMLFITTDKFLRQFGIASVSQLPDFGRLSHIENEEAELTV